MIYTMTKKSANGKKFQLEDKSGDSAWYEAADNVAKFNKWTKEGSKVEANIQDDEIIYMKNLTPKSGGGKSWGGGNAVDNEAKQESITNAVVFKGAVDVVIALIASGEVKQDGVKDATQEIYDDLSTVLKSEKKKSKKDDAEEETTSDDDGEEDAPKDKKKKVKFDKGDNVEVDSEDFTGKAVVVSVDEDEETVLVKDKKNKKYEVKLSEVTVEEED